MAVEEMCSLMRNGEVTSSSRLMSIQQDARLIGVIQA